MTPREKEIINLIKKDPFISQQEIADTLNIARSSVSVHILNLSNKGVILGRGYLLSEAPYIAVIGGASIDIAGIPEGNFNMRDSNPGHINISQGGVGRNIAENLARLNQNVGLITVLGKDVNGKEILVKGREIGIDFTNSIISEEGSTSTYLSILDQDKDMLVAINQMDILEKLNSETILSKKDYIARAKVVVLDTNLSKETLVTLLRDIKRDYIIDTVSVAKVLKIKDYLSEVHTLKGNVYEMEALTDMKVQSEKDIIKVGKKLVNKGVKNVIITWGEKGLFYFSNSEYYNIKSTPMKVKNSTGAGDALTSAIAYGYFNDMNILDTLKFSVAASRVTLVDENTISRKFNLENIREEEKEIIC